MAFAGSLSNFLKRAATLGEPTVLEDGRAVQQRWGVETRAPFVALSQRLEGVSLLRLDDQGRVAVHELGERRRRARVSISTRNNGGSPRVQANSP